MWRGDVRVLCGDTPFREGEILHRRIILIVLESAFSLGRAPVCVRRVGKVVVDVWEEVELEEGWGVVG
jgi:hypothetical protein